MYISIIIFDKQISKLHNLNYNEIKLSESLFEYVLHRGELAILNLLKFVYYNS